MDLNERIARALGYQLWKGEGDEIGHWCPPKRLRTGFCLGTLPDYAHSLDACLPVLAALREKGWFWAIDQFWRGKYVATMGNWNNTAAHFEATADSPAAALAECIATILETE